MTQSLFVNPVQMPYFSPVFIPSLPSLSLSESERAIISKLQMRGWRNRYWMQLTDSYYRGEQLITNLNIAIPPELSGLRTLVGWPRKPVDPVVQRSAIDGIRLRGATDADQDMADLLDENGMDAELPLVLTDSLVMGRGWITLGSPESPGDAARMCVESPLNISASWNLAGTEPKEILQSYWLDNRRHAVLYVLGQTIYLAEDDDGSWELVERDAHGMDFIPAQRIPNMPRTDNRDGGSEITPALMSVTDSACRLLLRWEVAGEFFSVPQKLLLGATESAFTDSDGNELSAWQTYISHVLTLERDDAGELPQVHQFQTMDPSVFRTQFEALASEAASICHGNPQDFGLYTQGNPISADALNSTEADRNSWIRMKHRMWGVAVVKATEMGVRLMNGGDLPEKFRRMSCDWIPPEQLNLTGMSDAIAKQVSAGIVPATSDVTRARLGYNRAERAQLQQDTDAAQEFVQEAGTEVEDKAIRAVSSLAKEAATPVAPVTP